jgi:hypothetical protein
MRYKSSVSKIYFIIFPLFIIGMFLMNYFIPSEKEKNITFIPIFVLLGGLILFILAIKNTSYYINENILVSQILFYKHKVNIETIRKIEYNHTIFVGTTTKLGWDTKGLIVYYNKFDDYFISPKNKEQFIAKLLEINPNIEIKI